MTLEQQPRSKVHSPSNDGRDRAPELYRAKPASHGDFRLTLRLGVRGDRRKTPTKTPINRGRGTSQNLIFERSANRRRSNGQDLSEFQIHTGPRISSYGHHRAQSRREPARPSPFPSALTQHVVGPPRPSTRRDPSPQHRLAEVARGQQI
jgi:hypothetical protein